MDSLERTALRHQAELAASNDDLAGAFRDWATLSTLYPDDSAGLIGLFDLLQKCGFLERAEAVLQVATMRFPDDSVIMMRFAEIAESRDDDDLALVRWRTVRDRFPTHPISFVKLVHLYRRLDRPQDVESVFDAAALRILGGQHAQAPKSQVNALAEAYVFTAYQQRRWAEVVKRWTLVEPLLTAAHPVMAYFGTALGYLNRYDEAETVLAGVIENDPTNMTALMQLARIAKAAGKPEQELHRLQAIVDQCPTHPAGYAEMGRALRERMRFDEAESYIERGMTRFASPLALAATDAHARQLAVTHGLIAHDRGDYQEALRRWAALTAILPNDPAVRQLTGATRLKISIAGLDSSTPADEMRRTRGSDTANAADGDVKDLVVRFESLGSNCEFGLVQRHFGAEPLGLLRWSVVEPETLCKLLEAEFGGMDAPDNIEMIITPGNEYFLRDRRYGTGMHTFIKTHEQDAERVLSQLQGRMKYLRRELIEDLRSAEKIFVYKTDTPLDEQIQRRVARAVQRFNSANMLLFVQVASRSKSYTSVEEVSPGLLVGHLDRPSKNSQGNWDISFDSWAEICRLAESQGSASYLGARQTSRH